ncbi:hypothetical protein CWATWH0005_1135 [Crocosphaera watsonii WH 0005]|uniref:Uncharacterized protein n=1 Tax=Crocosphaera watsonii WH 0005 TaxID=423472 RepID=T2IR00_CROWT|nr:hypothetical protein CWATWH0005_1135 [Crocosphaera watsonii WH 0005]
MSIQENKIESLDLGFVGENQIFGTPITFTPVNESSSVTGLITLFIMGTAFKIKKSTRV